MVKKVSDLYLDARKALMATEDQQTASMMARSLLSYFLGMTQEQVIAQRDQSVSEQNCMKVEQAVNRILDGEPIAYIIGQWDFYGMRLEIDRNVLIPRDDTCAVTALAIKKALFLEQDPRILDLCTGSGCIGLAIAHRVKDARLTLADISQEALSVAKKNVALQKLSGRVSCIVADARKTPSPFLGKFDLIVSNPPYITGKEMETLDKSVKDYEPHLALYGGEDGLDFYRCISDLYRSALKPGGFLCFEFGMGQGDAVCEILQNNGYTILERTRDNNNIERAVVAQYGRKEV